MSPGTTRRAVSPKEPDLDPRLTKVGGDDWNTTAVRLAREYRVVRDDLDNLAHDIVEGKLPPELPNWEDLPSIAASSSPTAPEAPGPGSADAASTSAKASVSNNQRAAVSVLEHHLRGIGAADDTKT